MSIGLIALPFMLLGIVMAYYRRHKGVLAGLIALLVVISVGLYLCFDTWQMAAKNPWPTPSRTIFQVSSWSVAVLGFGSIVLSLWACFTRAAHTGRAGEANELEGEPRVKR
jgi:hypothetical protein